MALLQANKLLNAPNWKLFINNQKIFWLSWHSTSLITARGFFQYPCGNCIGTQVLQGCLSRGCEIKRFLDEIRDHFLLMANQ